MAKKDVLVFCAHNDDQILGAGGTLAKYAKEGKDVTIAIFSFGEGSHPWLKKKVTVEIRVKESKEADDIIGAKDVFYLGLSDETFLKELEEKGVKEKVKHMIKRIRPSKVFTHSCDDPHPHHRAVHRTVMEALDELKYKCDVYSFDIWNPLNISKRNTPKMVVDITDTFQTKIEAFKRHKSQWITKLSLLWSVYAKAWLNGLKNDCKYAEVFYKIR